MTKKDGKGGSSEGASPEKRRTPAAARETTMETVERAAEYLPELRREYLRRPGVTAVDVGYRYDGRVRTEEVALRVHVERKLPEAALAAHELISRRAEPKLFGEFRVDVLEASYAPSTLAPPRGGGLATRSNGTLRAEQPWIGQESVDRKGRVDPLVGGVSCGNPRITAGTLGAIVWDKLSGKPSILSNRHVLCGSTSAQIGEPILQPGSLDGGTAADRVAKLTRWRLDKDADAALAELTGERGYVRDILGLRPLTGIVEPALGMEVEKSGRTTGVTEGMIDGLHLSFPLNYGGGTVVSFVDQVRIVPLPPWPAVDYEVSEGGDSGSIWLERGTGNAMGLHFAGETNSMPSAEHAVANRMSVLAEALEFSVTPLYVFPPKPLPKADLFALLRAYLCLRYPYLCGELPVPVPHPPAPPFPPGPWPPPPPPWRFAGAREQLCRCCGALADGGASQVAGEEELARQILARLGP